MIADFGTNYGGIGWLTLVLPLGFVAVVAAFLFRSFRRTERDAQPPDRADR